MRALVAGLVAAIIAFGFAGPATAIGTSTSTSTSTDRHDPRPPPELLQGGLIAAGDLNWDGHADVLDIRYTDSGINNEVMTVIARVGETGRPLWHKEIRYPASDTIEATPARVGRHGRPGVLLIQDTDHPAGRDHDRLGEVLTALAGPSGHQIWSRNVVGGSNDDISVEAITNELPGRAADVLIGLTSQSRHHSWLRPEVVSGVDGHVVRLPAVSGGRTLAKVYAVPDLNGDGLNDVVVARAAHDGTLRAENGTTGKPLWSTRWPGIETAYAVTPVGRISAGPSQDLVASLPAVFNGKVAGHGRLVLIRGRDGKVRWDKTGDVVAPVHRAGPALVPAVELITVDQPSDNDDSTRSQPVGAVVRAFTPGGHRLFDQHIIRHTKAGVFASTGEVFLNVNAGDIEPDGAREIAVTVDPFTRPVVEGFVDGRTGRLIQRPLGVSLNSATAGSLRHGRGADIIDVEPTSRHRDVIRGVDGLTGHRYFSHGISLGPSQLILETFGIRAAGDGCSDIGLTTEDDPGGQIEGMLSGSGHVLWTLRFGDKRRLGGTLTRHPLPHHLCA